MKLSWLISYVNLYYDEKFVNYTTILFFSVDCTTAALNTYTFAFTMMLHIFMFEKVFFV